MGEQRTGSHSRLLRYCRGGLEGSVGQREAVLESCAVSADSQ